jgi:hypothetical protein|tara:strand:- start:2689 stop:2856 length:168 start_codon:yes stop_codon:yes gene_type:complete
MKKSKDFHIRYNPSDKKIIAEIINGYFNHEVPDNILPSWIKGNEYSKLDSPFKEG